MPLVVCPDCYRQISDAAPTCVGCGRPMTSHWSQPPTGVTVITQPPPRRMTPLIVAIASLAVLLIGLAVFAWRTWSSSAAQRAAAASTLKLGDVGVLHSREGLPTVMLFDTREDFDTAVRTVAAKDDTAYKQLVRSRATFVPSGTKARELEAVLQGGVRVQLVEGPRPGYIGWTFAECLQASQSSQGSQGSQGR
jgi:hypothetical protein